MTSDAWRDALGVLRSRFEKAAERFLGLHHRLYEYRGNPDNGRNPLPPSPHFRERIPHLEAVGFAWRRVPIADVSASAGQPVFMAGWVSPLIPHERRWCGSAWFHGEGHEVFYSIAEEAWNLIRSRPNLLPIPALIRADLSDFFPEDAAFIPDWSGSAWGWAQAVHWIGRQKTHPVFQVETRTWWNGMPGPCDESSLAAIRRDFANTAFPTPDFEGTPPRMFSDITNIFSASAWALDWLANRAIAPVATSGIASAGTDQAEDHKSRAPISPETRTVFSDSIRVDPRPASGFIDATPEALAAFERLAGRFASILATQGSEPPDLHLVLVRAPAVAHQRLTEASMKDLPVGLVRPDLARKPKHSRFPEVVPSIPATRILYLGDAAWIDRFAELSMEGATILRAHSTALDEWVKKATVDERFYMSNLWSLVALEIGERFGPKGYVQRYRWGDDPLVFPFLPFEDDAYRERMALEEAQRGSRPGETSDAVSIGFFQVNAFEVSLDLARFFISRINEGLKSRNGQDSNRLVPDSASAVPTVAAVASQVQKQNAPSEKAIQCYRLMVIRGDVLTQAEVARQVYGDRRKQSNVSRDIKRVEAWLSAGNVLPDLTTPKPRTFPVDPAKLDTGRREDRGRR
jgi:hypothetical protein